MRRRRSLVLPGVMSVTAALLLFFGPDLAGFAASVGAAILWSRWLEDHPEPVGRSVTLSEVTDVETAGPRQRLGDPQGTGRVLSPRFAPSCVLVYMPTTGTARAELEAGARLAGELKGSLLAAYVVSPGSQVAADHYVDDNVALAGSLGATVIKVVAEDVSGGLVALADRESVTHAVFGQDAAPVSVVDPQTVIGALVARSRIAEVQVVTRRGVVQPGRQ